LVLYTAHFRQDSDAADRGCVSTDISQMTFKFVEIMPPFHRHGQCIPSSPCPYRKSHRASLRQAKASSAKGRRAKRRSHLETDRQSARSLHTTRMPKIPRQRRIRFSL